MAALIERGLSYDFSVLTCEVGTPPACRQTGLAARGEGS
jgi:hypothetical protein